MNRSCHPFVMPFFNCIHIEVFRSHAMDAKFTACLTHHRLHLLYTFPQQFCFGRMDVRVELLHELGGSQSDVCLEKHERHLAFWTEVRLATNFFLGRGSIRPNRTAINKKSDLYGSLFFLFYTKEPAISSPFYILVSSNTNLKS